MPRPKARPARTLAIFFIALAVIYGLVAIGGKWKPELGLDLQGGTQISMTATNPAGGSVPSSSLNEARDIIDQRVNGSGITAATVTTDGSNVIQVSIPGKGRVQAQLANRVRQTAKLAFRMVACGPTGNGTSRCTAGSTSTSSGTTGSTGTGLPRAPFAAKKTAKATTHAATHTAASATPTAAPATAGAAPAAAPTAAPTAVPATGTTSTTPADCATSKADLAKMTATQLAAPVSVTCATSFMKSPPTEWQDAYNKLTCPQPATANAQVHRNVSVAENANRRPLVTCDQYGQKYLLSPAVIDGSGISDANYTQEQNQAGYVVTLDFKGSANVSGVQTHPSNDFADATGSIACSDSSGATCDTFAIVLDGNVVSAPTASQRISGQAQITGGTGGFSLSDAQSLATNLKYGSLPLEFPAGAISQQHVGPSLAGNQLDAGLWAGGIGLVLVMIYCLLYYRGLGVVVLSSLVVAASWTYGMVLLLSKTAGFTLTLPGIAGFIVAVGITADSFIIFFERIRDEMRDGKSMRVAVESGWVRARRTRIASSTVTLLSAVVLYIFATGDVKGFGFALGLSTVIDLLVIFFFTKPLVSNLAKLTIYNSGTKFSGLSQATVGVPVGTRSSSAGGRSA